MARRVRKEVESVHKVRVLTIGASEVSRLRSEWISVGGGKLELGEETRIKGKWDRREGGRIEELKKIAEGEGGHLERL